MEEEFNYDLFVIGGGSGGLSAARTASALGAKVGLADFVKPSPYGTKWGIGGTCVNVGCIPKKLFHYTSLMGDTKKDLTEIGWPIDSNAEHSWATISEKITDYIKSLNFGYRKALVKEKVKYYNKLAKLLSKHEVELTDSKGEKETIKAKYILLATGGRPTRPDMPGGVENSISSDDIFWMDKPPGKTLLVGASYIALECAGFLKGLGMDVTVMVRSILLRGFDQAMANKVGDYMEKESKIKFIRKAVPTKIEKNKEGRKVVTYKQGDEEVEDVFDTVLFAIGRSADTGSLGLEGVGVNTAPNGKIIAGEDDKTSVDNIFAIGDVAQGRLELTPVAIMAGKLLSRRLFGK